MGANTLAKLANATQAVEDAKDIYSIKIHARNLLICQAIDEGYDQSLIATTCNLSNPRPMQIAAEMDNRREQISPH